MEDAGLLDGVGAEGAIDHEPPVVRGGGVVLLQHAADLRELLHQIALRVETSGGIDEEKIAAPGAGGLPRVEGDGGGVGAGLAGDQFQTELLGPRAELFDGGGAERVAGGDGDGVPLLLEQPRQLGGGGGRAGAVDPDHHDGGVLVQ